MSVELPTVFLSHGAGPSFYLDAKSNPFFKGLDKDSRAADFLRNFTKTADISKPETVLVISAHWEEKAVTVNTNSKHSLYYDYGGFPPETYKLDWPVLGSPEKAKKVVEALNEAGIQCRENPTRGLDHGVFVPLKLVFPKADVQVIQISLLRSMNIADHLAIGEALGRLRSQGVLIVGSGFATHKGGTNGTPPPKWAVEFRDWLHDVISGENYSPEERKVKLLACEKEAPNIARAHPSIEHFIPLLMCSAAAGYKPGKLMLSEFHMGSLLNEHYLF
ncbi:DIOXL-like protein [Mya arenaria]|uniref:DIOXL-like protein n=1 Tax=Mya arenaria TaxID=6604 RepID=A0ABY7FWD7_MYAAR|nr:uncharacterized protein LOC128217468 [Mya arenaria]WAR26523.1 DIOXL-like protein [Mya arenaria]